MSVGPSAPGTPDPGRDLDRDPGDPALVSLGRYHRLATWSAALACALIVGGALVAAKDPPRPAGLR